MANSEHPKSGRERLKAAITKDCHQSGHQFTAAGCSPLGHKTCNAGYCSKFNWVLARAQDYAQALGLDIDAVLDCWEDHRSYWYMNYYQESNQPKLGQPGVIMFNDWVNQLKTTYGPDPKDWAFQCPGCHHVQTMGDFIALGVDGNSAYVECIGRHKKGVGCDWAAYGFLTITKTKVVKNAIVYDVFDIAPVTSGEKAEAPTNGTAVGGGECQPK